MTTKRAIMTLIGVSLLVAAALAGPADTKLGRCLPKSGDVSGWQAVSSSYKYGSGNGIADIYNGGYEKLLQKGMKAACTQNYSNDSRRINVYGNEFDTAANAKATTTARPPAAAGAPSAEPARALSTRRRRVSSWGTFIGVRCMPRSSPRAHPMPRSPRSRPFCASFRRRLARSTSPSAGKQRASRVLGPGSLCVHLMSGSQRRA